MKKPPKNGEIGSGKVIPIYSDQLKNLTAQIEPIIAYLPGYIFWKDTHSQYMWCNQNLADFLKLKHRWDVYGKTDYDFPFEKKLIDQFVLDDQKVIQTGIPLTKEYELKDLRVNLCI